MSARKTRRKRRRRRESKRTLGSYDDEKVVLPLLRKRAEAFVRAGVDRKMVW
jgi:hypothetical protein